MNISQVGKGKVVLIAGGGKVYTDIAARFCKSQRDLDSILASPYDKNIVKNILESGHLAATEFDNYIFGVEGYSRVTEVQLVRKRMASYLIKSGRTETNGKRSFDVVLPKAFTDEKFSNIKVSRSVITPTGQMITDELNCYDLLDLLESWYDAAIEAGMPEEDARYLKPQATEFKAIIGMNAHALRDWFKIRCCFNAQSEIRDLANKMLKLCKEASPDLFEGAGSSCVVLGYCPEKFQCKQMKGTIPTHEYVKDICRKMVDKMMATKCLK